LEVLAPRALYCVANNVMSATKNGWYAGT
jgi:hypothetical protein